MAQRKVAYETIRELALSRPDLTNDQIGEQLQVSEASVRRALKGVDRFKLLEGARIEVESPLRYSLIDGDIALAGDIHVPITKWGFLNRFLLDMKAEGVTTLGIPGDFWHADFASSFDYKQSDADMETEKRVGNETMQRFLEQFDKVILSWGNHDARYHKMIRYGVSFVDTMKMMFHEVPDHLLAKVEWTNLDHFWVDPAMGWEGASDEGAPWYVCHPKSYSSIPLTQSRRIAAKTLSNVITGHSHHHAVGHDVSGKFTCAEVGGFFDASRTEYLQRSTQFPNWNNGYAIIHGDNSLTMRSEKWKYE